MKKLSPREVEVIRRNPPEIMNIDEMAAYASLCPHTIRDRARRKLLPYWREGRAYRFRLCAVKEALARREIKAAV